MKKITLLFILFIFNGFSGHAQSVADYTFEQSTEVYSPVTGNNSIAVGDDGSQDNIPIGFTFMYGTSNYTTFSISTNGFIRLGDAVGGQSWTNFLGNNAVQSPLIAAFWDDHNRGTGSIQYAVSGVAPDRVLEIGWNNINISGGGNQSTTAFASFKMRLRETTGQIEFIYAPFMNPTGNMTASIGLNEMSGFLSVSPNSAVATASSTVANNTINTSQFLLGQKFTFAPSEFCKGIPAPGATIATSAGVCSDIPFTLSLENTMLGFGTTYQWQTSLDGNFFTDVPLATSRTFTTSQSVETKYQCIVTCNNESVTSTLITVYMNPVSACYCIPTYTAGKTQGDLISNVSIAGTTLANSTGVVPVNPSYTYFSGQPNYTASLQIGQTYDISVSVGTGGQQHVTVWIDFNDDGVFDVSERVGNSAEIGSNGTGTFPITLNCNASPGLHRMRVREVWNTIATVIEPCNNYQFGETEDYDITVLDGTICLMPTALGTSLVNPSNAQLTWTLLCNPLGADVHFGPAGTGIPVGAPSHPGSDSPLLIENLVPGTAYEFYVRTVCADNQFSDWAGPYNFVTMPPPIANDECINALALEPGTTFIQHAIVASNVAASTSIGAPTPVCAAFGFGGDIWFSVTAPPDGKITIELQANPGSAFVDSGMTAFTGNCENLTAIGCSDDEGVGSFSKLNLTGLTAGQTVYARVWEYGNNVAGTFKIAAWSPTLSNNNFDPSNFKYFPNPVKDHLNLSYAQPITKVIFYNMLGQEVLIQRPEAVSARIDVNTLPAGSYLVKVLVEDSEHTIKISKQ